jgi:hypothetical protein
VRHLVQEKGKRQLEPGRPADQDHVITLTLSISV